MLNRYGLVERRHDARNLGQKCWFSFNVIAHDDYIGTSGQSGVYFLAGIQAPSHNNGRTHHFPHGSNHGTRHRMLGSAATI